MTNNEACERAERAIDQARKDSDNFDHGGMASWDIMELLREALRQEFRNLTPEA